MPYSNCFTSLRTFFTLFFICYYKGKLQPYLEIYVRNQIIKINNPTVWRFVNLSHFVGVGVNIEHRILWIWGSSNQETIAACNFCELESWSLPNKSTSQETWVPMFTCAKKYKYDWCPVKGHGYPFDLRDPSLHCERKPSQGTWAIVYANAKRHTCESHLVKKHGHLCFQRVKGPHFTLQEISN